jgi:hypothetical protein
MIKDYQRFIVPLMKRYPNRFPKEWFSFERFQQCSSVVACRYFYVDCSHGDAMVPLADVFNHRTDGEHIHLISADDCDRIELSTVRPVQAAGQQVFNTYGQHSNAYLMMKYGFTEPGNPYDVVSVDLRDLISVSFEGMGDINRRVNWWLGNREQIDYAIAQQSTEGIEFDNDCLCTGDRSADSINDLSFNIHYDGTIDKELSVLLVLLALDADEFERDVVRNNDPSLLFSLKIMLRKITRRFSDQWPRNGCMNTTQTFRLMNLYGF